VRPAPDLQKNHWLHQIILALILTWDLFHDVQWGFILNYLFPKHSSLTTVRRCGSRPRTGSAALVTGSAHGYR
jgi:hypothetical protein